MGMSQGNSHHHQCGTKSPAFCPWEAMPVAKLLAPLPREKAMNILSCY